MKTTKQFKVGDKVMLRKDGLQLHSRSIPAYMGYTQATMDWRNSLSSFQTDRVEGTVTHAFKDSATVAFGGFSSHVYGYMLENSEA